MNNEEQETGLPESGVNPEESQPRSPQLQLKSEPLPEPRPQPKDPTAHSGAQEPRQREPREELDPAKKEELELTLARMKEEYEGPSSKPLKMAFPGPKTRVFWFVLGLVIGTVFFT